jgi:hypothetical protein
VRCRRSVWLAVCLTLDADPTPRIAGWCLPRGQGKSTLVAALGLYELMCGGEVARMTKWPALTGAGKSPPLRRP